MRTSSNQFLVMLDYMERNGDLSTPARGPRGRLENIRKWDELCAELNMDTTGTPKTEIKWKKVWSDFKNNTKKKAAKIRASESGSGSKQTFTQLEQRLLNLLKTNHEKSERDLSDSPPLQPGPLHNTRTSTSQFLIMLDFMERNGDLNIPAREPRDRLENIRKWDELCAELNMDTTGTPKTHIKWKKVWSDFKNNTKKKVAKVRRASESGSGLKPTFTELEQRLLKFLKTKPEKDLSHSPPLRSGLYNEQYSSPVPEPEQPSQLSTEENGTDYSSNHFLTGDIQWRNLASEFMAENSRFRERELQQQAQWQILFARCLDIMERFVDGQSKQ